MNYLLIIVCVVLAVSTLGGYRKGFMKTVFELISWILVLVICNVATPKVADFFIEETSIDEAITRVITMELNEMFPESDIAIIEQSIPEEMRVVLFGEEGSLRDSLMASGEALIGASSIVYTVVSVFSFVVVVAVARILIIMINLVLGVATKLPVIGSVDKWLGIVCGGVKGLLICWMILAVVSAFALTGANTEWAAYITQSQFLTWLQERNFILNMFVTGQLF